MLVNLKAPPEATWITVSQLQFLVRPLSATQAKAIKNANTKQEIINGAPSWRTDEEAVLAARFVAMVQDWKGLQQPSSTQEGGLEPLPCTDEAKKYVAEYHPNIVVNLANQVFYLVGQSEDSERKN